MDAYTEDAQLFWHEIVIEIIYDVMSYTLYKPLSSGNDATGIHGIILATALLDAIGTTRMLCFCGNHSDNVGGDGQKLRNHVLKFHLPVSYRQRIAVTSTYIEIWSPGKLRPCLFFLEYIMGSGSVGLVATLHIFYVGTLSFIISVFRVVEPIYFEEARRRSWLLYSIIRSDNKACSSSS